MLEQIRNSCFSDRNLATKKPVVPAAGSESALTCVKYTEFPLINGHVRK